MFYYGSAIDFENISLEEGAKYMEMARWLHKDFKESLMGASLVKEVTGSNLKK